MDEKGDPYSHLESLKYDNLSVIIIKLWKLVEAAVRDIVKDAVKDGKDAVKDAKIYVRFNDIEKI